MRAIATFVLVLVLSNSTFGQKNEFDELVRACLSLSEKFLYKGNFTEAEKCMDTSFFYKFYLCQKKHKVLFQLQKQRIKGFKSILFQLKSESEQSLSILNELSSAIKHLDDKNVVAEFNTALSSLYYSMGRHDSASYYNNKALTLYQETGNKSKEAQIRASILSRKHVALKKNKDKQSVLDLIPDYKKEIDFSRKQKNKYVLAYNTRHLGQIYLNQLKNYDKAMALFSTSLNLREEIGFEIFLPASYSSIGDIADLQKNEKLAIKMYKKSIDLAEDVGFVRYQFHPSIKIGDIYARSNDSKNARVFYENALKSALSNNYQIGVNIAEEKLKKLENH